MPSDPLRLLIVDDEPLARARLRHMLEALPDVKVVGEAASGPEARQRLAAGDVDLLLLDIQMPGEDGFTVLRALDPKPPVVFVTAYDHYAVRAFEENAVDYLLKPFSAERLSQAIQRARRERERPEDLSRRLAALLGSLEATRVATPHLDRFTVRLGARQIILRSDEVLWFGTEDKLVFAATASTRYYVNFTLDQLEKRLDSARFVRVHRAAIVNLDWAASLHPGFAGTYRLQLKDPARTEVPVARARARLLRERLGSS